MHGTVFPAHQWHVRFAVGETGGGGFVNVDAQPGFFLGKCVAIVIKTAVTENLFFLLAKFAPFLNAKIGNREVDVD